MFFDNKVYCKNSEYYLSKIPENVFDIVVTSPPYNIDKDYNKYNDDKSMDSYRAWVLRVSKLIYKVMKDDGSFFINLGNMPSDQFRAEKTAQKINNIFELQNTFHWIKHISVPEEDVNIGHYKPINSSRYVNQNHEYIYHFTKDEDVSLDRESIGVPYKDKSNVGRYNDTDLRCRGNTWFIPYNTINTARKHPSPFPVKLPEMCIKLHGIEDNTRVLDPFGGTGSVGVASKNFGVNYTLIDYDEKYIKIAREKLSSN